jgi:hypothetical protein
MRLFRRIRVAGACGLLLAAADLGALPARAGGPDPGPDFNGDGYADLAVGVPLEDVSGSNDAGGVEVIYGSVNGLNGDFPIDDQFWTQSTPGVQGTAEPGDRFGAAMAAGDFDGDGFDDLAIGVPYEDLPTGSSNVADGGIVQVLYGSSVGLTAGGDLLLSQDYPGIAGVVESGDAFGFALEAAQLGNGNEDDLVIGSPYEGIESRSDAGAVNIVYGSPTGLNATGNRVWTQDTAGIADTAQTGDHFGWSLSAADFGDRGGSGIDLAIGVPDEDLGSVANAGAVTVIYNTSAGLDAHGSQQWTQNDAGIVGDRRQDDRFGFALSAANFGKSSEADLAIGSPYEDLDGHDEGSVIVIYGTWNGLASLASQTWHQDSLGIEGDAEGGDLFGYSLAAADFGNGFAADLAIGVPGETKEQFGFDDQGTGAVNVLYGAAAGLRAQSQQFWWQASSGIEGETESWDRFGSALAAADFGNGLSADLAIGVPGEGNEGDGDTHAGAVNVIYHRSGTNLGLAAANDQFWWQASDTLGDSAEDEDRFGSTLAN